MLRALSVCVYMETGAGLHWDGRENRNVGYCYSKVHLIGNSRSGRGHQALSRKRIAIARSKHSDISIVTLKMERVVPWANKRRVGINDNRSVKRLYGLTASMNLHNSRSQRPISFEHRKNAIIGDCHFVRKQISRIYLNRFGNC